MSKNKKRKGKHSGRTLGQLWEQSDSLKSAASAAVAVVLVIAGMIAVNQFGLTGWIIPPAGQGDVPTAPTWPEILGMIQSAIGGQSAAAGEVFPTATSISGGGEGPGQGGGSDGVIILPSPGLIPTITPLEMSDDHMASIIDALLVKMPTRGVGDPVWDATMRNIEDVYALSGGDIDVTLGWISRYVVADVVAAEGSGFDEILAGETADGEIVGDVLATAIAKAALPTPVSVTSLPIPPAILQATPSGEVAYAPLPLISSPTPLPLDTSDEDAAQLQADMARFEDLCDAIARLAQLGGDDKSIYDSALASAQAVEAVVQLYGDDFMYDRRSQHATELAMLIASGNGLTSSPDGINCKLEECPNTVDVCKAWRWGAIQQTLFPPNNSLRMDALAWLSFYAVAAEREIVPAEYCAFQ